MTIMETCKSCGSSCGHFLTVYTHVLNKPLISALRQLVDYYEANTIPCNLQKDLNLTKNQYNNFQKLQYFGLVKRTPHGWYPTNSAINFIYGRTRIINKVATIEGKPIEYSHPYWQTIKALPKLIGIADIDVCSWKQREEYQEEKQNTLFTL